MNGPNEERRKYKRFDTEMRVYFRVAYDIKTRVRFRLFDRIIHQYRSRKYSGISKNISIEGLCFISRKRLRQGLRILVEVYLPNVAKPVTMQGEVRWSKKISGKTKDRFLYHTGVKLVEVDGKNVAETIHFDEEYKVVWSVVLEAVFNNFKEMVKQLKKEKK